MGGDRRPNVGGRHEEQQPRDGTEMDQEQVRLDAKSLGRRTGVDGHEGRSPADVERDGEAGTGEG